MPTSSNRMVRINDEILRELANIIRQELKDPRIGAMTSVVKVDTTNDLKYCKVSVSVLGEAKQKEDVMHGLKNAQGFIRKLIASRINLRNTPEFKFILDDTLEYAIKLTKLIEEVNKPVNEEANKPMNSEEE